MDIANRWRHSGDRARNQAYLIGWSKTTGDVERKIPRYFGPPQHPDQPPHGVVVDRGTVAWAPDETDDRKTFKGIAIQQILPVVCGIGLGELQREPIIGADQIAQRGPRLRAYDPLVCPGLAPVPSYHQENGEGDPIRPCSPGADTGLLR